MMTAHTHTEDVLKMRRWNKSKHQLNERQNSMRKGKHGIMRQAGKATMATNTTKIGGKIENSGRIREKVCVLCRANQSNMGDGKVVNYLSA